MNTYQMMICPDDPGTAGRITPQKSIMITENGSYKVSPDSGYNGIAGVDIDVDVTNILDLSKGITFAYSKKDAENYKVINADKITDLSHFFEYTKMEQFDLSIFTGELTGIDNVFEHSSLMDFSGVRDWDVSRVTSLRSCFYYSKCRSLDLTKWDVSNVVFMDECFNNMAYIQVLDLSTWRTPKLESLRDMFQSCNSLVSLDISNFTIKREFQSYERIFSYCGELKEVKVINCDPVTKQRILDQLQKSYGLSSYTWTLGDDGIIRRS